MSEKYKDSLFGIKGLTPERWNENAQRKAHEGAPEFCPSCRKLSRDHRSVKVWQFGNGYILWGACKECSDAQTRSALDYYEGKDLLKTVAD